MHNSLSCPRLGAPLTGTQLLYVHLQFRPQKCRKTEKIQKIRYKSVITKNPLYLKIQKSILNRLGVLRSVGNLWEQ